MKTFSIGKKTFTSPVIMGVLNVTPDSFSDGGLRTSVDQYLSYAIEMVNNGASIIDIGAESTRPGFTSVSVEEELSRLKPVLKAVCGTIDALISVDTTKPEVAEVALSMGADIINDVNGLRDMSMLKLISSADVPVVIMHMFGSLSNVHSFVNESDSIDGIYTELNSLTENALNAGVKHNNIIVDPGVGFGKSVEQNISIIDNAGLFGNEFPVLVGASRKRVVSAMYPDLNLDEGTVKAVLRAVSSGADILRVHNVQLISEAINRE